jgi:hypothetical protein
MTSLLEEASLSMGAANLALFDQFIGAGQERLGNF